MSTNQTDAELLASESPQPDNDQQRRSKRIPRYTEKYKQFMGLQADLEIDQAEPTSYSEAIASEEGNCWKDAIQEEYDSLMANKTLTLVNLPPGRTTIKNKWVFKIKPGHNDVAQRYKARLVAKGYTQRHGIDYQETYAPVVKYSALRTILAMVAALDLEIVQLDVKTAFLYGSLEEETYMDQPEGFVKPGAEDKVCLLQKCIYGLKQAPRVWNSKFNEFLLKSGLTRSIADPCVYYRRREGEITIVAIYVDDGLVSSNKMGALEGILSDLKNTFEMRTLPADRFIGLDIVRNRSTGQLHVSQQHFIEKLLNKFNMSLCHPLQVPADPNSRLDRTMSPDSEEKRAEMKNIPYREAIGGLMYLMTMTRPDISFAVNQVAKFSQDPGPAHWKAVKRILAYIAGTKDLALHFGGNTHGSAIGYSDADYAGDIITRRSVTGFIFLFKGGPISWTSRQQQCVSLSTTESEFVAACESSKEAIWLSRLINEIQFEEPQPMTILCDNQSAIRLVW